MRSLKFPKMFNTNSTNVWKDDEYLEATRQNTLLLLHCEKGELLGDPYFGLLIKNFMFDQNSPVLQDALADMLYTQIALFIPQIKVERRDIQIVKDFRLGKVYCYFKGLNQIDYTVNTFSLLLFDESTNI